MMTCVHFEFVLTCKLGVQLHDACPKLSKAKHLWLCELKTVSGDQCVKREEEEEEDGQKNAGQGLETNVLSMRKRAERGRRRRDSDWKPMCQAPR